MAVLLHVTCTSVLIVNIDVFPGMGLCFDEMCLEKQFLIHSLNNTLFVIQPTCFSISIEPLCFKFRWLNNSVWWNQDYFTLKLQLLGAGEECLVLSFMVMGRISLWWMAFEKQTKGIDGYFGSLTAPLLKNTIELLCLVTHCRIV